MTRRHVLGQWFTPAPVADLALALALDGAEAPRRVLDPTCGDGAILARVARALPGASLVGVDVDADAAAAARARVPGARIVVGDVLDGALGGEAGFDLVIGNPPWVRPDRLGAQARGTMTAALRRDAAGADAADLESLIGRADLAAACLLRALGLVRSGGRVAMVLSTALLDAGYTRPLWRAVRARAGVRLFAAAPAERWFKDAAVNAMIAVLEAGGDGAAPVRVARLRAATAAAAAAVGAVSVGAAVHARRDAGGAATGEVTTGEAAGGEAAAVVTTDGGLERVADVRAVGGGDPARWAAALRASPVWFEIEQRAGEALVPLGELAELRRGVTSGANEVFYLPREVAAREGIEADVLTPLVHSPRDGAELPIAIDPDATPLYALVIPPDGLASRPGAKRWIQRHKAAGARPTSKARDPWWSLPVKPARLFLTKAYGPRFVQRLAPRPVVADQRVYAVEPRDGVSLEALAAALNTTWTALALESLGRASMGHGAVEWTVADAARLPVLDVRRADDLREITQALDAIAGRAVRHVTVERTLPDRRALDLAVSRVAPGLEPLLDDAHDGLCASVLLRDRWKLPVVPMHADDEPAQSSSDAARS